MLRALEVLRETLGSHGRRLPGSVPAAGCISERVDVAIRTLVHADYAETFCPPVSPLTAARKVASLLLEKSSDGVDVFLPASTKNG